MVQWPQHLRKAALHMLRQGCGCKWLLQFKIKCGTCQVHNVSRNTYAENFLKATNGDLRYPKQDLRDFDLRYLRKLFCG